jgi:diacylglycerol kinase family enzyme
MTAAHATTGTTDVAFELPGKGLGVLVNANAKRGGRRVAVQIAQRLAGSKVRLTKTIEEIESWLRIVAEPRAILVAGGDGSVVALVNALHRVTPEGRPFPPIAILPLGTGNGLAHAIAAPKLDRCLRILSECHGALPTRTFGIFECDGVLAHFAGSGWDAMILDDYKNQLAESKGPAQVVTKSVWGYVSACLFRTAPRVAIKGNPHLILENLGDDVFTISGDGKLLKMHGLGRGSVIYDGPAGCASVGTSPEFGYGFKAFPFAERLLGSLNVRVYDRGAVRAVVNIPRLWKGKHPLPGMHDWFSTAVRMTFSRPIPLQIGGDAHGARQTVEYRISPRVVRLVDWRRLI